MRRSWLILAVAMWALGTLQASAQPAVPIAVGGWIVDSDGQPVAGAGVELVPLVSRAAGRELRLQGKTAPPPVARTVSGEDGRFEISAPGPGMWEARVTARGFVPRRCPIVPLLEPRELPELEMGADVPLRVRVVDSQGQPVAGARVTAGDGQVWDHSFEAQAWPILPQLVTTGADGTAVVARWDFLPRIIVTATAAGHPPTTLEVDPAAAPAATIELRLPAGKVPPDAPPPVPVRVTGRVLEERTQAPVAGALVWPEADPGAFVLTDAKGAYVLPWPDRDENGVAAGAVGYLPAPVQPRTGAAGPAFLLRRSAVLRGIVVDPRDRPIADAVIRTAVSSPETAVLLMREEVVYTRADGSFSIHGLALGGEVMLSVSRDGYTRADRHNIRVPAAAPVRVVLKPSARVAGRVIDEAGKPVPDALVKLARVGVQPVIGGSQLTGHAGQGYTGDDGTFAIEPVETGRLRLRVRAAGFLQAELPPVEVAAGEAAEDLEVVLRRGAVVTGRVVGPDGEPVASVRVEAAEGSDPDFEGAFTDAVGRYRLEGLSEGLQSFAAAGKGFQRAVRDLEVRSGENRLDFRLEGGHEVSGRVLDAGGEPMAGASVLLTAPGFLLPGDGSTGEPATTGADGSFRIADVYTGVYDLHAVKSGYAPGWIEDVDVAGPVQGLELRLPKAAGIHGRLVGLDRADWPGLRILAARSGGGFGSGDPDSQGGYRISDLAAGEWRVAAETASGRRARGTVTVAAGADAALDLEFRGGLTVTGRVLRGGSPVPEARVTLTGPADLGWGASEHTDPQGAFRIEGLAPGAYDLLVTSSSFNINHHEALELAADRDVVVDIAGQRVSGRVVDAADRSPIDRALVSLEPEATRSVPLFLVVQRTGSDVDGTFTVSDVAPGTYRLRTRVDGYAAAEAAVEVGDADVDGVVLALQTSEGLTLEVQGALGSPPPRVETAFVDASGRAALIGQQVTGENGRVQISSAPPGTWQLLVAATGYATVEQTVEVPGPTVRLVLPRAANLTVEAPGLPDGATVTVTGDAGNGGRPFRSPLWLVVEQEWHLRNGQAVIHGLPPGDWQVRVTAPDGRTRQAEATTAAGQPARVVVE